MGVVYEAWHLGLKRAVAVKMVLAGEFAQSQRERNDGLGYSAWPRRVFRGSVYLQVDPWTGRRVCHRGPCRCWGLRRHSWVDRRCDRVSRSSC
jgi:hypothetical protein